MFPHPVMHFTTLDKLEKIIAFWKLNLSRQETYNMLKASGILSGYIVKAYDVLHTFSSDYIADEIIDYMREKGVVA